MKTNRVLIIAVVLAVSWMLAASVQAQEGVAATAGTSNLSARQGMGDRVLGQLNLTEKQKIEIAVIRERTRKDVQDANSPADKLALIKAARGEIKALLTPEQLAKLQEIRQNQRRPRTIGVVPIVEAAAALNLTDDQKTAINAIREDTRKGVQDANSPADKRALAEAARGQIKALLTPDQLKEAAKISFKLAHPGRAAILAQLNLTDAQKAAIKAIRQSTRKALQTVTTRADKRAIREGAWDQIKAVLTPAQLVKLERLRPRK